MHQNAPFARIRYYIVMHKDYKKLFTHLEPMEPPVGLFNRVMNRIREEKQLIILKRRIMIFSVGLLASVAMFIPVFRWVQADLTQSGFLQFFSLVFSDFKIVITYWQNFSMSLLETVPAVSLAILFATVFAFLELLKFWTRDIKLIFKSKQLINI